jgi:hypothetical protein
MPVITANEWARVWAKAALDSSFRVKLETDPLLAYRQFRREVDGLPPPNNLDNDMEAYQVTINIQFSGMTTGELQAIIDANPPAQAIHYNELKKV